eukprot:scaffold160127_cov50-Prasinocladus_malaysianus.AAC.1
MITEEPMQSQLGETIYELQGHKQLILAHDANDDAENATQPARIASVYHSIGHLCMKLAICYEALIMMGFVVLVALNFLLQPNLMSLHAMHYYNLCIEDVTLAENCKALHFAGYAMHLATP